MCIDCFGALNARQELEAAKGRRLTPEEIETELQSKVTEILERPVALWPTPGLRQG